MINVRSMVLGCLGSLLLVASVAAQPNQANKLQLIFEQQQQLKNEVDSGKVEGLTERQATMIRKSQQEVFSLIDGKATVDALSLEEKIRLQNALERIEAEIVGTKAAQDDKQVCWRERKLGSKIGLTRCATVAERERVQSDAQYYLSRRGVCILAEQCGWSQEEIADFRIRNSIR